jgi:hypothetical protein
VLDHPTRISVRSRPCRSLCYRAAMMKCYFLYRDLQRSDCTSFRLDLMRAPARSHTRRGLCLGLETKMLQLRCWGY